MTNIDFEKLEEELSNWSDKEEDFLADPDPDDRGLWIIHAAARAYLAMQHQPVSEERQFPPHKDLKKALEAMDSGYAHLSVKSRQTIRAVLKAALSAAPPQPLPAAPEHRTADE